MNFFSSPEFLAALGAAYFPGRKVDVRDVRVGSQSFRVLDVEGHGLVTSWPFLDYLEPLADSEAPSAQGPSYIRSVAHGRIPIDAWEGNGFASRFLPSPLVDWSHFSTQEALHAHLRSRRSSLLADSRRQRRRLEKELGEVKLVFDDPRPETFELCLRWKSAQYLATGNRDLFADPAHVRLFSELTRRGALSVSALCAGERVVAAHLGVLAAGRFYYWIPAYDPGLRSYSPGRLLLESLVELSRERGDREFDFLLGDEPYKWQYATHTRLVGPLGRPPLPILVKQRIRAGVRRILATSPPIHALVRRMRNAMR